MTAFPSQEFVETEQQGSTQQGASRRPLLDSRAAGTYTGLGERYIRRLRAERRITCVRIGGRVLFDPDDLDELIDRHREPAMRPVEGCTASPVAPHEKQTSLRQVRRAVG